MLNAMQMVRHQVGTMTNVSRGKTIQITGPIAFTRAALFAFRVPGGWPTLVNLFSREADASEKGPQEGILLPMQGPSSMVSYGSGLGSALVVGEEVLQRRWLCHHFLGSWKWEGKPLMAQLMHRAKEPLRSPCRFLS